jgi:nucleotide-binding universal stress UspA family protein
MTNLSEGMRSLLSTNKEYAVMGKILCATRGGEASIRTQEAAIKDAKNDNHELVFIYIFDMEFLARASYALRQDVMTEEMEKMAEFLMAMAVERAEKEQVAARFLIRQGAFVEELRSAALEEEATLVILGRPIDETSAFKLETLEALAEKLTEETGIEFCLRPD